MDQWIHKQEALPFGDGSGPPGWVAFQSKIQNRKSKICRMQALVPVPAERDNLLHAIYEMFRHVLPFQGAKVYQLRQAALANTPLARTEAA